MTRRKDHCVAVNASGVDDYSLSGRFAGGYSPTAARRGDDSSPLGDTAFIDQGTSRQPIRQTKTAVYKTALRGKRTESAKTERTVY
jgi:hypothetical protein